MGKTVAKVIGVIAFAAAVIYTGGTAGLFFAGTNIGLTVSQIALAISSISLSIGFAPELPSLDAGRLLAANLTVQSNPLAIRGVPLGRLGIAGQVLFRENIEGSGSTPDELLVILGLAGYPANSLEKYWLNGELVFSGDSTTGPGAITTGKFANDLWVWFRTGEETTAAFPEIAALSTAWNAKVRKLRGIPCVAIRLKVTDAVEGRFEPLAQMKGAKLYDPRLDSTVPGGAGLQRFADPTTWAWSENPKLAELLYVRGADVNGVSIFGMDKPIAAIDLENFASEANICEEQITVNAGGTIDRYTCNGLLIPEPHHRPNLQALLSATAGTMDASGGIYRTFAGAWRAPSIPLTESDIDGAPTNIQLQKSPSEEINIVSGSIADPNDAWEVKEYPERRDAASIAQIGEHSVTLDLPFTNDHRIAQRIAKINMKRLNARRHFGANYWLSAIPLQPGDIVTQTYSRYGITAETFRVQMWGLEATEDRNGNRRLTVPMALVEEQQSWFDWDAATEEKATTSITPLPTMDRRPKLTTLDGVPTFVGPLPPANPKVGWLWRDTDTNILFRWSGSAWVDYATDTKTADQIDYLAGATVESLQPAESGADTTSRHGINAVDNPEFEAGDVSWTPSTASWTIVEDAVNARRGSWCARVIDGPNGASLISDSRLQVDAGDRILAQAFFKRTAGTGTFRVLVIPRDSAGATIAQFSGNTVSSASYAASRLLAIMPAGAVTAEIRFQVVGGASDVDGFADGAYMAITLRDDDIQVQAAGFVNLGSNHEDTEVGVLPQSAGISFTTDGFVQAYGNGTPFTIGKWWSNAPEPAVGDNYQVRCVSADAAWDFGTAIGTFVTMTANATWRIQRTTMEGAGTDFIGAVFEIREVGETTVLDDTFFSGEAGS